MIDRFGKALYCKRVEHSRIISSRDQSRSFAWNYNLKSQWLLIVSLTFVYKYVHFWYVKTFTVLLTILHSDYRLRWFKNNFCKILTFHPLPRKYPNAIPELAKYHPPNFESFFRLNLWTRYTVCTLCFY